MVVGGANGQLQGDRHIQMPKSTPQANLLVSVLNIAGIPTESIGNSTGAVPLIS
jgi:hypothetical protein